MSPDPVIIGPFTRWKSGNKTVRNTYVEVYIHGALCLHGMGSRHVENSVDTF
jgi:hypothetical protein